jgi:hypothetical protein
MFSSVRRAVMVVTVGVGCFVLSLEELEGSDLNGAKIWIYEERTALFIRAVIMLLCRLTAALNMPVQRLNVAILPLDLPCTGSVTHSG